MAANQQLPPSGQVMSMQQQQQNQAMAQQQQQQQQNLQQAQDSKQDIVTQTKHLVTKLKNTLSVSKCVHLSNCKEWHPNVDNMVASC